VVIICSSSTPLGPLNAPKAHASSGIVVTLGAGAIGANSWTTGANANGTTNDAVYATAAPAKSGTTTGLWSTYGFDTSLPTTAAITKVEIIARYKVSTTASVASLDVQSAVSGTNCPTTAINDASEPVAATDFIADITSCRAWVRSDLLNANFNTKITAKRGNSNTAVTFSLDNVRTRVTYDTPDFTQSSYGFYKNTDSTDVGLPLASQNNPATIAYPSSPFRLRMDLAVTTLALPSSGESFKLQYVGKGTGTCAAPTGGTPAAYTDVTAATAIAYNDNTTPATNTALTSNGSDPTDGANTIIDETYLELNNFTNPTAIATSQDGKWDFSLKDNAAPASTTYCLRAVLGTGVAISTYTNYPEISTSGPAALTTTIVDAVGSLVGSPSISFSSITTPFVCTTTTGTFGIAAQKIRVLNTSTVLGWSMSIAATLGSTALWSAGTPKYDFNDPSGSTPGCTDGGDADNYAGQLSLDPSVGTITSQSSCTSTGITKGGSAAFSEGVTNSITLLNGSNTSEKGCYWDFTGVTASQKVPTEQNPGAYSINLTMTVVSN
jgi:hypothetical protein